MTKDDGYPLRILSDLLMSLGHGNITHSSLDLLNWYLQLPMAPDPRNIIGFIAPNGYFEWLRIPFGPKSVPIAFQRMINTLFSDMVSNGVYVNLDYSLVPKKQKAFWLT